VARIDCTIQWIGQLNSYLNPTGGSGWWTSNSCGQQGRVHLVCIDPMGSTQTLENGGWVTSDNVPDAATCPSPDVAVWKAAWEHRAPGGSDVYCWYYWEGSFVTPPDCDG
jgi:hypothetical protein